MSTRWTLPLLWGPPLLVLAWLQVAGPLFLWVAAAELVKAGVLAAAPPLALCVGVVAVVWPAVLVPLGKFSRAIWMRHGQVVWREPSFMDGFNAGFVFVWFR